MKKEVITTELKLETEAMESKLENIKSLMEEINELAKEANKNISRLSGKEVKIKIKIDK